MEQIGYIRKIEDNKAEVEIRRIAGCGGGCSSCGGCDAPSIIVNLQNGINAREGDFVEIKAKSKNIIQYALIAYMIPFTMLVIGIASGVKYFQSKNIANYEIYGFLVGLIFLAISFMIVKLIDRFIKNKNEPAMEMVRILN